MPFLGFGRTVDSNSRKSVLDYYQAACLVSAYQDDESGKYNSILGNHVASLRIPQSQQAVVDAAEALRAADHEALRRHSQLTVPDIAGPDWAAWHALYLAHLQWIEASIAAFEGAQRGFGLQTGRVESLFNVAERKRRDAEKASASLLKAVGATANEVVSMVRVAEESVDHERATPTLRPDETLEMATVPVGVPEPNRSDTPSEESPAIYLGQDIGWQELRGWVFRATSFSAFATVENGHVDVAVPQLPSGLLSVEGVGSFAGHDLRVPIWHKDEFLTLWELDQQEAFDWIDWEVLVTYLPAKGLLKPLASSLPNIRVRLAPIGSMEELHGDPPALLAEDVLRNLFRPPAVCSSCRRKTIAVQLRCRCGALTIPGLE